MSAECRVMNGGFTISKFITLHSALITSSNSVHRVEEVFTLGVDANAQPLAGRAKAIFEFSDGATGARHVGDDDHRKLALHDRLINVHDAALRLRENLRHARHDARMI